MSIQAMNADTEGTRGQTIKVVGLWILQVLLAGNFLFAGGAKLAGVDMTVGVFAEIGIGQWFRYVVGVLEVAGAVLLLVPQLAVVGAWGLAVVMAGAVLAELFVLSGNPVMPLVLLVLAVLVARGRARGPLER